MSAPTFAPAERRGMARTAILEEYRAAEKRLAALGGRVTHTAFVQAYNRNTLKLPPWVRTEIPELTLVTLRRWLKLGSQGTPVYQWKPRRPLADTRPELGAAIERNLTENPDLSAPELLRRLQGAVPPLPKVPSRSTLQRLLDRRRMGL